MLRIKELRDNKGLNMRETAHLLNMPYTTYVNYEKGLREPSSEVLIQLADFFSSTVDYLVGRTAVNTWPPVTTPISNQLNLSISEQDLIRKFRKLDDRGRSAVLNVLDHEYAALPGDTSVSRRQA